MKLSSGTSELKFMTNRTKKKQPKTKKISPISFYFLLLTFYIFLIRGSLNFLSFVVMSIGINFQGTLLSTIPFITGASWSHVEGPRWQSGNTLASHLCGRGSIPVMAVSGKAGSCLPLVGSLQYRTLANYMYWFPLPFQLPVVI